MNELNRHKKSDKIKWITTGVFIVLLSVMVAGLCMQLFAKDDKYKPSEWFKKSDTEQTQPEPDTDENDKETATYAVSNHIAKATSASTYSDNGISAQSEPVAFSSETYSSLGVALSESEISQLKAATMTGSVYVPSDCSVSTTIAVKNNLNSSTMVGALVLRVSAGVLPSAFDFLFLPKTNVFSGVVDGELVGCTVIGRTSEGSTSEKKIFSNSIMQSFLPHDNFFIYQVNSYEYNVLDITYNFARTVVPLPPDPVKEGHTFVGWYYDSAFTRPYDNLPIYSDTTLYAKFEINKYTVTFNSDGGSAVSAQTVDWNTSATLTTPTRAKYAFKGWYLPNGTQYTNQPIKENTTLTARWERNVFTVIFNTDGGSSVNNTEVNLNASVTLPSTTKTGYTFVGWFMADGTRYTNQPVSSDIELTAHWERIMCTVTFYVDGEIYDTKQVEYGTAFVTIAETANELNLCVLSVRSANGNINNSELANMTVTDDSVEVVAEELTGTDKVINTVKNNKWAIIGGVAGGVALIAILGAIIGGTKRRKR